MMKKPLQTFQQFNLRYIIFDTLNNIQKHFRNEYQQLQDARGRTCLDSY